MSTKFILVLLVSLIHCSWSRLSARVFRELPAKVPLTLAEWPSYNIYEPEGPGTYAFGYEIEDPASGNVQFRDEEKLANGTVRGSYGHMRPDGLISLTRYIADENGYRSETETFKQPTKRPVNVTSTELSTTEIPNEIDENDLSPETISPEVAQALLDQQQLDLYPTAEGIVDPDVAAIINGVHPLAMISMDKNKNGGSQPVNSLIPSKLPVVSVPMKKNGKPAALMSQMMYKNDKFYHPLIHEKKDNKMVMKNMVMENGLQAETREAQWYKELIRSRRKDFLQKYAANNDEYMIPAFYFNHQ